MKKFLAVLMSIVLVGTMSALFVTADEASTVEDGYVFNIHNVDTTVAAEKGLILTTQETYDNSKAGYSTLILCEVVKDNLYKAKKVEIGGKAELPKLTLEKNDIVISIHSDSKAANKDQKAAAMKVKEGMFFTLKNIDLSKAGAVTDGTATVSHKDPNAPKEPVKVEEKITVDGKFDDNAWLKDSWKHVDSENGKWQAALKDDETRKENFDYQFRADDKNLYFAFKLNNAPLGTDTIYGNGKGSNLRLWFQNDDTFKAYTHFVSVYYKDGEIELESKKNTDKEGNKSADWDITGADIKATHGDDFWYVEAKIPFELFGATTDAKFYVSYSAPTKIDDTVDSSKNQPTNNALVFGKYAGTEKNRNEKAPYAEWDDENDVDVKFEDVKLGTIEQEPDPEPEPEYKNIMGEEVEDPGYKLEVTAPKEYIPGEEIKVTITLKNVKPESGLGLIDFNLYYDADKVEPKVKNDGDLNVDMDKFLTKAPSKETWEALCMLEEDDTRYHISYNTGVKAAHAKEDGSLVIEVPFIVKDGAKGTIAFQVPHKETTACDYDLNDIFGNASLVEVKLGEAKPDPDESSEPEESSKPEPEPKPGDAGMVAIAIIAVIALAGAATIAVKKRSR